MKRNGMNWTQKLGVAGLLAATGGMVLGSGCSLRDVRNNVLAGTYDFVAGFTTNAWEAVIPPPDELFGRDDAE